MRTLFIILACLFLSGCARTEWQVMRDDIYNDNPKDMVCRHRVSEMTDVMWDENEIFDIVFGYVGTPDQTHVRIEQWINHELIVLDPMQSFIYYKDFVEEYRWRINQGYLVEEIKANRFLVRCFGQIGRPYTPKKPLEIK